MALALVRAIFFYAMLSQKGVGAYNGNDKPTQQLSLFKRFGVIDLVMSNIRETSQYNRMCHAAQESVRRNEIFRRFAHSRWQVCISGTFFHVFTRHTILF